MQERELQHLWLRGVEAVAAEIQFPAAEFSASGNFMWVIARLEDFQQCNGIDLKRGHLIHLEIVDSSGNAFRIEAISALHPAHPWWHWPYEWLWQNCRIFNISFDLSGPVPTSLDDFKAKIMEYIDLQRGMWESGIGVPEIKAEVRAAKTHREAIEVIYGQKID